MAPHSIAIMTDSTSDLPAEASARYGIVTVPLYVLWGSEELRDGVDIDRATFYARLKRDAEHPKTSQPTPSDFREAIERTGADEVLILTISTALSGTYNSAQQAQQLVSARVVVVDSRTTSMGLGWQVLAAARARERGAGLDEMAAEARRAGEATTTLFTVETLEYLHRGGRIGGAAWMIGTALQLKPVLAVDNATGRVEAIERIRTRRRALQRVSDLALERFGPGSHPRVAVMHAAAPEEAAVLRDDLAPRLEPTEIFVAEMTPVLGVHCGPGLVGFSACRD